VDDDEHREMTPTVVETPAGRAVKLRLVLDDHEVREVLSTPRPGQTVEVRQSLPRLSAKLSVGSTPPGADVFIDDEARGKTPITVEDLPRRAVTLRVTKEGYGELTKRVDLDASRHEEVSAVLERQRRVGTLWINADVQRVRVEVDGRVVANHVPWRGHVDPGNHTVRLVEPVSGAAKTRTVRVTRGGTKRVGFFFGRGE
jgi:hypothetical protein